MQVILPLPFLSTADEAAQAIITDLTKDLFTLKGLFSKVGEFSKAFVYFTTIKFPAESRKEEPFYAVVIPLTKIGDPEDPKALTEIETNLSERIFNYKHTLSNKNFIISFKTTGLTLEGRVISLPNR